jgi:hypothetical protein
MYEFSARGACAEKRMSSGNCHGGTYRLIFGLRGKRASLEENGPGGQP